MRTKQNTQPEFVYQFPSSAKITDDYFARYVFISDFLDSHPEIGARVHKELRKPLANATRKGPRGQARSFTSDTVLRLCLVKVLENTSYRGTVVRVDDSSGHHPEQVHIGAVAEEAEQDCEPRGEPGGQLVAAPVADPAVGEGSVD